MNRKIFITGILFSASLLLSVTAQSQVNEAWVSHWNNQNQIDEPNDIAVDALGNVYVTGTSEAYSNYCSCYVPDYVTIKYNSSGAQQWAKTYNGTLDFYDKAYGIAVDASGNVYVTGGSYGLGDDYDYVTIKYDAGGNQQWVSRYDGTGTGDDEAYDIGIDVSGNIYITGKSYGISGNEFTTIKYNPATGDTIWVKRTIRGGGKVLKIDALGNINAGGYGIVGGSIDAFTVKYSPSGSEIWTANYDYVTYNDEVYDLATDAGGNVYVAGYSDPNTGSFKYDYITIMYNSSGVQQWATRYDNVSDDDWALGIAANAAGSSIYVTGKSKNSFGDYDYETIKYNSSGTQQWEKRYDGTGNDNDEARAIAMDISGNVYVTGGAAPVGTTLWDYVTIKYDGSTGNELWNISWNDEDTTFQSDQEIAIAMALDATGNVYVTGWTDGTTISNYIDIATIKYTQGPGGIEDNECGNNAEVKIFPNPFSVSTTLSVIGNRYPVNGKMEFAMYDLVGREVTRSVILSGAKNLKIERDNLPSGMYFYQVKSEGEIIGSGKIIISGDK